jgi:hypothetical protein
MYAEIPRDQFLKDAHEKIKRQVMAKMNFGGLTANYRGNVMELPISTIKGCHYEIGFHLDCHEIALHFQGTPENNLSRSESFWAYLPELESILGYPIILGSHEAKGRRRLWIKLPINPLTPDLLEKYSNLTASLIIFTLPILHTIMDNE